MAGAHEVGLTQISGGADARWGVLSLPIPGDTDYRIDITGTESQAVSVAFWPRSEKKPGGPKLPRRSLVFFDRQGVGDKAIAKLAPTGASPAPSPATGKSKWAVDVRYTDKKDLRSDDVNFKYLKEECEVVLRHGKSETAIRLGNENGFGFHWWQYVIAEKMWSGPLCEAWRIGGHIYVGEDRIMTKDEISQVGGLTVYPDDTEAASVYLILFNDGTVQATAHWINGRIYGGYGNHKGAPIVAFRATDGVERQWTGDDPIMQIGDAVCDFSPAADLVSEENPGAFRSADGLRIWQPFKDTRITLRHMPDTGNGPETQDLDYSADGLFQGVARSVRWNMKLGGGNPSVARYLAPREWYAANCEFSPFPVEPVEGEFTRLSRIAADNLIRNQISGRFTSGAIYRYLDNLGKGVIELSMDANEGRSLFRRAYWDHDPKCYDLALRNAYFCADISVDHSRDLIHYHGDKYPWLTYSLIYMRFSGIPMAYIETGDPYLLETSEAVARYYASQHLQNWPRKGIGRDADPLTGFLLLWEYTGKEEYLEFARQFAGHVAASLDERGHWLSGSGVGPLMGCNACAGSTWNGGHLMSGFTEYVMRDPDVSRELLESGRKALKHLYTMLLAHPGGFHPASTGFVGRIHWYLACRLGDEELMEQTRQLMKNLQDREHAEDEVIFSGGRAHHMNNYVDNLLFYECTKDTLPALLRAGGKKAYPIMEE